MNTFGNSPGVLSDQSGEVVVKPCKAAEIAFYESCTQHPEFANYIPTFCGTLALAQEGSDAASAIATINKSTLTDEVQQNGVPAPVTSWTPSNGAKIATNEAIVLENVAAGLRKPNILDVKLGARLWADDAPEPKRIKLDKVSDETTSRTLGFRFAGMKTWQGEGVEGKEDVGLDGYKSYDKEFGRQMRVENVKQGFEEFFFVEGAGMGRRYARRIIKRFLEDLRGLKEVLEREESRMYSASLLFVYEGDGAKLERDFEMEKEILDAEEHPESKQVDGEKPQLKGRVVDGMDGDDGDEDNDSEKLASLPKIQAVKMIDFAHANWTPGEGPDENVLHGVRNVIKILEELLV